MLREIFFELDGWGRRWHDQKLFKKDSNLIAVQWVQVVELEPETAELR